MLLKHLCHFTRKGAQDVRRSRRRHGCRPARTQTPRAKRCFLVTSLHQQRSYPLVRAEALSLKTKEKVLDSRLRGNDEQRIKTRRGATPSPPNPPLEGGGLEKAWSAVTRLAT